MTTSTRILRRRPLEAKTGLGKSAIYDKNNRKSASYDPTFPKPIHLGDSPNSPVGWIEAEVDAWLAMRAAKRADGGQ